MIRFFGRLIIKLLSWIISLLFGFIHFVLSLLLHLASLVVGLGITLFLIIAIANLFFKDYFNAGVSVAIMGAGYLILAAIAFIVFLTELGRDFFMELSFIKLFR